MFGLEDSLLAGSFSGLYCFYRKTTCRRRFFSLVIILDYGHFEKSFIFFHFLDYDYICTPNLVASMEFVGKSMILKYQFL